MKNHARRLRQMRVVRPVRPSSTRTMAFLASIRKDSRPQRNRV
ncbi:hypothetical protein CSIRO_1762 [Bradyrhizobiaceae bacterium SG-6C]|nr:hypothetical protein CSIRO_1762 [Bradyrhizobiaceae bacterium SG-6C]